ncbi:MAG: hypothetical protein LBH12_04950, partial [Dysgonamonadaceae bacterium]|nr:hypothetical protein [Dysgonamonadaceae bacterium]
MVVAAAGFNLSIVLNNDNSESLFFDNIEALASETTPPPIEGNGRELKTRLCNDGRGEEKYCEPVSDSSKNCENPDESNIGCVNNGGSEGSGESEGSGGNSNGGNSNGG